MHLALSDPKPLVAGLALAAAALSAQAQTLHARFEFAPGGQWTTVRLALASAAWRTADGAPASAEQVRDVIARLDRIEVGGRCAGFAAGATKYPCGYAVELDDRPGTLQALGWDVGVDGRGHAAAGMAPEERASQSEAGPAPGPLRFVGVRLPASAHRAVVVALRIRPVSNPLVPSIFEPGSGQVVLHAVPRRPGSCEPGSGCRPA